MVVHRISTILLVFVLVAVGHLLLPALLGVWSIALSWVWLAGIIVVFGAHPEVAIAGIVGAFVTELVTGAAMGSTAAGFFVALLCYRALGKIMTIPPVIDQRYREWNAMGLTVVVAMVLVAVVGSVALAVEAVAYGREVLWNDALALWYTPQSLVAIGLQLLVLVLIMRGVAIARAKRHE